MPSIVAEEHNDYQSDLRESAEVTPENDEEEVEEHEDYKCSGFEAQEEQELPTEEDEELQKTNDIQGL